MLQQVELASTFFNKFFQLATTNFVVWHCLRWVVIRASTLLNLQRNNVALQVAAICCSYYFTFIRAKLTRPRTFCARATGSIEENPKWPIYKGKFFWQIGPLSRDRARILYLIILWAELTLHKAVEIAVAMETAAKDMLRMRDKESEVNQLRKKPERGDKSCYRCGNTSHDPFDCRFKYEKCRNCGKTGHIHKVCRSKRTHRNSNQREIETSMWLTLMKKTPAAKKNSWLVL